MVSPEVGLCDEHSSDRLIECGAIHVDRGAQWGRTRWSFEVPSFRGTIVVTGRGHRNWWKMPAAGRGDRLEHRLNGVRSSSPMTTMRSNSDHHGEAVKPSALRISPT